MFAPKSGRSLRIRLVQLVKREGLGGIARRLWRYSGQGRA
jgi:hypothetical protein